MSFRVWVRFSVRVRVKFKIRMSFRVCVRFRVRVRVKFKIEIRVWVRVRVKDRVMVGMALMYRCGSLHQYSEGVQVEIFPYLVIF